MMDDYDSFLYSYLKLIISNFAGTKSMGSNLLFSKFITVPSGDKRILEIESV